jgi:hypothetical protein
MALVRDFYGPVNLVCALFEAKPEINDVGPKW